MTTFPDSVYMYVHQPLYAQTGVQVNDALNYLYGELEDDAKRDHRTPHGKIEEYKRYIAALSPDVARVVTARLLEGTGVRIQEMLNEAQFDEQEAVKHLADYEKVKQSVDPTDVELARRMLFFVAELKTHRALVYHYGVQLGCPEKQLLHHDFCKLGVGQFEGFARYFKGGMTAEDKPGFDAAWALHQYEEHHCESYSKEGFDFDSVPEERIRNNMRESVADLISAVKQRGGSSLIEWLKKDFPKKQPHPRLIPFIQEALIKAHELFGHEMPCWNDEVQCVFNTLKG